MLFMVESSFTAKKPVALPRLNHLKALIGDLTRYNSKSIDKALSVLFNGIVTTDNM